jgi:transcriptional regulator with XRE-family HTH domain
MKDDPIGFKYDDLPRMLEFARENQGYSKRKLARIIGTSDTVVGLMERGEYNPTLAFLDRYARGLGIKIELNVWIRQKETSDDDEE